MLNFTATLTHDIQVGTKTYFITNDNEIKEVTLKGVGVFNEEEKEDEIVVLVEIEIEEGKKETAGTTADALYLTIEEAESAMLKKKADNEANQIEELKKLHGMIVDRLKDVTDKLQEHGIDIESISTNQ